MLPQLVDALFKLMNDIGNEEVVQTLDNLNLGIYHGLSPTILKVATAQATPSPR